MERLQMNGTLQTMQAESGDSNDNDDDKINKKKQQQRTNQLTAKLKILQHLYAHTNENEIK